MFQRWLSEVISTGRSSNGFVGICNLLNRARLESFFFHQLAVCVSRRCRADKISCTYTPDPGDPNLPWYMWCMVSRERLFPAQLWACDRSPHVFDRNLSSSPLQHSRMHKNCWLLLCAFSATLYLAVPCQETICCLYIWCPFVISIVKYRSDMIAFNVLEECGGVAKAVS